MTLVDPPRLCRHPSLSEYARNPKDRQKCSIFHSFMKRVELKSSLKCIVTCNIDCLELKAGISRGNINFLHGNIDHLRCLACNRVKRPLTKDDLLQMQDGYYLSSDKDCHRTPGAPSKLIPAIQYYNDVVSISEQKQNDLIQLSQSSKGYLVIVAGLNCQAFVNDCHRNKKNRLVWINLVEPPKKFASYFDSSRRRAIENFMSQMSVLWIIRLC